MRVSQPYFAKEVLRIELSDVAVHTIVYLSSCCC
jgi:hypothetical protein